MGFNKVMQNKTNYELLMMVNEKFRYSTKELTDILVELDRRGVSNDRVADLKKEISDYQQKHYQEQKQKEEEEHHEQNSLPKLFTETSLYIFSFIFSTFFASIVMAINLKEVQKQQAIFPLVSFGLLYTITVASITQQLDAIGLLMVFLLNGAGAYIILRFFWKPYIGNKKYEKRSLMVPLLIGLALTLPLIYFMGQSSGIAM
jgi:glycerol uptake facilitator-like aquaporin